MKQYSTKIILAAVFALITFVATAPAAYADGGQLDAFGNSYAVSNFTVSGHTLDTTVTWGPGLVATLLGEEFGNNSTLAIVSNGTTYTFSDVKISGIGMEKGGVFDVDFSFKNEKSSAVPEPATMLLIGCGLFALALVSSRKSLRA